jgi:formylglycine-generating enzyme required for sulfatase activity
VGSYPEQRSPWGLLDTAGGVSEFTEWVNSAVPGGPADARGLDGSSSTDNSASIEVLDFVDWHLAIPPEGASFVGLRVAGIVPAPGTTMLLLIVVGGFGRRRRS